MYITYYIYETMEYITLPLKEYGIMISLIVKLTQQLSVDINNVHHFVNMIYIKKYVLIIHHKIFYISLI